MATYILPKQYATSFLQFVELEASCENVYKVDLYWHKTDGLKSIITLHDGNQFVITFCNMPIQAARKLKCTLFKKLCINQNYKLNLM